MTGPTWQELVAAVPGGVRLVATDLDVLRAGASASQEANQDPIDRAFLAAARERLFAGLAAGAGLLATMLAKRDQWLRNAGNPPTRAELESIIEGPLKRLSADKNAFRIEPELVKVREA